MWVTLKKNCKTTVETMLSNVMIMMMKVDGKGNYNNLEDLHQMSGTDRYKTLHLNIQCFPDKIDTLKVLRPAFFNF